jgi:hypothetical protein
MKFILILSLCFLFAGCFSQEKAKSRVSLDITSSFQIGSLPPGGLVLYIINRDGTDHKQRMINLTSTQTTLQLYGGTFDFVALSWNSPFNFGGTLKCGRAQALLTKPEETISLNLSEAECLDSFYTPGATLNGSTLKTPTLINCNSISGATLGGNCNNTLRGMMSHYRFRLLSMPETAFSQLSGAPFHSLPGLSSGCNAAPGPTLSSENLGIKIPFGSADFRPSFLLETFTDAGCTTPLRSFYFPNGLGGTETTSSNVTVLSNSTTMEYFLETSNLPAQLSFSGPSTSFSTLEGTYLRKTFTLTNVGGSATSTPVTFSLPSSNFKVISHDCPSSIPPNGSCQVVTEFFASPNLTTTATYSLEVSYNGSQMATLSLTGVSRTPWVTNGTIHDLERYVTADGSVNRFFLGGEFHLIGKRSGGGGFASTGGTCEGLTCLNSTFPRISGTVFSSIPDENGGFYIGGSFTHVGGAQIKNLAHIDSNGNVISTFTPNPNHSVTALYLEDGLLYVGGNFTQIAGSTSSPYFTALNASSGSIAFSFNVSHGSAPNVQSITSDADHLYVGGQFTQLNVSGSTPTARNGLAVFDKIKSGATIIGFTLNPVDVLSGFNSGAVVRKLLIDATSTKLYVAGAFLRTINGPSFLNIASFDIPAGPITLANPIYLNLNFTVDVNNSIFDILLWDDTLFVAGAFSVVNSITRNGFAAVNAATGALRTFNPGVQRLQGGTQEPVDCYSLGRHNSTLLVGGVFNRVGSSTRQHLAAFTWNSQTNSGSTTPEAFIPNLNNTVRTFASDGLKLFVGGDFSAAGSMERVGLAVINANTGELESNLFNIPYTQQISTLAKHNTTLYIGGSFTSIAGVSNRKYLTSLSMETLSLGSWAPSPNGVVSKVLVADNKLFVGGKFTGFNNSQTAVSGQRRVTAFTNLGPAPILDINFTRDINSTGTNSEVKSLFYQSPYLYVGGNFIDSTSTPLRYHLYRINTQNNSIDFTPSPSSAVNALTGSESKLYVGLAYSTMGTGLDVYSISGSSITQDTLDPYLTNVNSLAIHSGVLQVAGVSSVNTYESIPISSLMRLNLINYLPYSSGAINSGQGNISFLKELDGSLFVGGNFNFLQGRPSGNLQIFEESSF